MGGNEPLGVLLLNLGGPDSLGAVRPFLYNLFSDRRIIRLGPPFMQAPLAYLISSLRAGKTKRFYSLIGGKSPILEITLRQASALEESLGQKGQFKVYVGMKYWYPFIRETVEKMHSDGIRRVIALSLYPHYSKATTGSSEYEFGEAVKGYPMEHAIVPPWYENPLYIEAMADLIEKGLGLFGGEGAEVLFSAHSLPVKFIKEGDPYVGHTEATIRAINERLDLKWHLSYQSKSGPVKWLEPSTEEMLKRLAGRGVKNILMVPISFVSDHIETLYEIDILYKGMAESYGMNLKRAESLNTHPLFIKAMEEMVMSKARAIGWLK